MAIKTKPKEDTIVIEANAEGIKMRSTIRTHKQDIAAFKSRIKIIQERMVEIMENTDEGTAVLKLESQLEIARANLKRRLESDNEWVKLTEDLADERLSLRDAERILSDYLLAYFADTKERQIELGPHEAHELILKGRLGKAKDFQTNLFAPVPGEPTDE